MINYSKIVHPFFLFIFIDQLNTISLNLILFLKKMKFDSFKFIINLYLVKMKIFQLLDHSLF